MNFKQLNNLFQSNGWFGRLFGYEDNLRTYRWTSSGLKWWQVIRSRENVFGLTPRDGHQKGVQLNWAVLLTAMRLSDRECYSTSTWPHIHRDNGSCVRCPPNRLRSQKIGIWLVGWDWSSGWLEVCQSVGWSLVWTFSLLLWPYHHILRAQD